MESGTDECKTLTYLGRKAGDEVRVVADKELVISPNAPQDIGALEGANTTGRER